MKSPARSFWIYCLLLTLLAAGCGGADSPSDSDATSGKSGSPGSDTSSGTGTPPGSGTSSGTGTPPGSNTSGSKCGAKTVPTSVDSYQCAAESICDKVFNVCGGLPEWNKIMGNYDQCVNQIANTDCQEMKAEGSSSCYIWQCQAYESTCEEIAAGTYAPYTFQACLKLLGGGAGDGTGCAQSGAEDCPNQQKCCGRVCIAAGSTCE